MYTLISHFASASGRLRLPDPHHVNPLHCEILGTPMAAAKSTHGNLVVYRYLVSLLCDVVGGGGVTFHSHLAETISETIVWAL